VGVLAAIMSSLDSQFMCIGTMFTQDILVHKFGKDHFSEKQILLFARGFIVLIVLITFLFSLAEPRQVFSLGIWCFTGFASLFPLVFCAIFWKRTTSTAAIASVIATAATWLYLFQDSNYGKTPGYHFHDLMPVVVTFATCALTLVAVSLVTKPPSNETLKKYFK